MTQATYFLLRLVAGLIFLQAGGVKIFDWFGGVPAEFGGHPAAWSQIWIGGVIEFYGGLLLMLGLFVRPVAFIASGQMAVAYWQFHFEPGKFWPAQNHGELAAVLSFLFLFIAAFGGQRLSLDWLLWGRRKATKPTE